MSGELTRPTAGLAVLGLTYRFALVPGTTCTVVAGADADAILLLLLLLLILESGVEWLLPNRIPMHSAVHSTKAINSASAELIVT